MNYWDRCSYPMPTALSPFKRRARKDLVTEQRPARVTVLTYNHTKVEERQLEKIEESLNLNNKGATTWITVRGMQDIEIIEQVASQFNLHPLLVEDIVNTQQRPKVDYFEHLTIRCR